MDIPLKSLLMVCQNSLIIDKMKRYLCLRKSF